MYLSIETFIFLIVQIGIEIKKWTSIDISRYSGLNPMFIIPKWIDDTLHHINTVMGNQFIVFFYFMFAEPNGSAKLLPLKTVPDKKIVVP
jgi:hypothetical protein